MIESYSLVSANEVIGSLRVEQTPSDSGACVEVSWSVDDNGRGAQLHEKIALDRTGMPTRWDIKGTSLMGGPVDETFSTTEGLAEWNSQADEGQSTPSGRSIYVPADGSAWSWVVIAKAALNSGGYIDLLPSGAGKATVIREDSDLNLQVVELSGTALYPKYILLDMNGKVEGAMDELMLVLSARLLTRSPELRHLREQLAMERLKRVSASGRLTSQDSLLLHNVRVLAVDAGTLGDPADVLVENGVITAIAPLNSIESPSGIDEIECAGATVMPGLHDMHAHVMGDDALLNIAAGVTTVRDMGNTTERLDELMSAIQSGDLIGPAIVPAGFIEGRSPYSARFGKIVSSADEAKAAVRWYADRGYTMVKLYNSMKAEWVPETAAEAHHLGMRVLGHVPAFSTASQAVLDGFDEVTHLNQLALGWLLEADEDSRTPLRLTALARAAELELDDPRVLATIELLQSKNIGVDTTAGIIERLMLSRGRKTIEADAPFLDHMPPSYQRQRRRTYVPYTGAEDLERYEEAFVRLVEILGLLYRSGIDLWPGTDDGTGFPLHRELELYALAGMPPAEILYRATAACAAHLGRGSTHGRVQVGYAADLILVDGDPTADISVLRRVALTVIAGRAVSPSNVYRAMGIKPFVATPEVASPAKLGAQRP
jgi:hypothetical protein